jgi:arsenite oxidase small subunit
MNNSPFKPSDPKIPGVSPRHESVDHAPPPSAEQKPVPARFSMSQMPPRWLILSTTGVVAVCLIAVWWLHGTSAKESNTGSETTAPATTTVDSKPSPIPEPLPVGPGEIATTSELAKDWSARKFIFRDPLTSREVPAMVVRLPGGVYWGFSLVEPYGSCEMEFVTDMEKLRTDYGFRASHPMVGDPCNRAVFDLTRYGSGPAGLVRGEIAHGAAVRPPMAIEIQVRGKQVLAKKIE